MAKEKIWLNLQNQYDLYMVKQKRQKFLKDIKPYRELHGEAV
jgi:plasmid maintenance system antidote protein VapI